MKMFNVLIFLLALQNVNANPTASNVSANPTASNVSANPTASNVSANPTANNVSTNPTANNVNANPKASNVNANPTANNVSTEDVTLSFEKIEIPMLIEVVYSDVLKTSYIIHDDVLKKVNNVTIRLKSKHKKSDMPAIMTDLLGEYGISIEKKKNHILFKLTENKIEPKIPVFYKPKYRTTTYLISMLAGTIDAKESIGQKRPIDSDSKKDNKSEEGINKLVDKNSDGILFMATQKKITLIMSLLKELDIPEKQIHIQALVYEVSSGNNESNAIQAVLKTIGSLGINLSIGASRGAGQLFEVTTKDLNILMNVFNGDNQFKIITSPSLLVRSGQKSKFTIGTETPTLGGIKYPDGGTTGAPVQSVEYKTSGTTFEVKPMIHEEKIDIELNQEISSFVQTTTGVSNSPTLMKRSLKSEFSMKSGQMVILAGLKEQKDTLDSTYLPFTRWEIGKEKSHSQTETILILYCKLVDENNLAYPLDMYDFIQTYPTLNEPLVNSLK